MIQNLVSLLVVKAGGKKGWGTFFSVLLFNLILILRLQTPILWNLW